LKEYVIERAKEIVKNMLRGDKADLSGLYNTMKDADRWDVLHEEIRLALDKVSK